MLRRYYLRNMLIVLILETFLLMQIQLFGTVTEAKHYRQPYGDIVPEEDEGTFQNALNARSGENRLELRNGQRGRHHNEFVKSGVERKRGEGEKTQYQNNDNNYYNRNNRNMAGYNANGWMVSSSIVELQHDNNTEELSGNAVKHKCNIWIPLDALDKYPDAEKRQVNKIAGSVYIEICCNGYAAIRWRGQTLCRPVCDNCQNGRCIAPGVCECYDEYVANDNSDCVFTCPLGCLNGRCYLDGSCQCDPGYKLDETRKFCRPICSKGCGSNRLHNCTEPEVCGCIKGYILTDNDCQPVCQHDCGSGGVCRQPDICECNPGFDLKEGICQADCYQKCDNGICFTRNRCICNPGFSYHERSTQCIPK